MGAMLPFFYYFIKVPADRRDYLGDKQTYHPCPAAGRREILPRHANGAQIPRSGRSVFSSCQHNPADA